MGEERESGRWGRTRDEGRQKGSNFALAANLARIFHGPDRCYDRPLAIDCSVVGSPLDMRAKSQTALSELASSLSDLEAGIALWMDIWRVPRRAVPDRLLNENVGDIF
jgi:hypothetical protein